MFSTKSVKSLKNLFASYHEPSPLSKQQSQKLLDGLKVSFRKQLDREYGRTSDSPASASASKPTDTTQSLRDSVAHRHLNDILTNPLFSYNKNIETTLPTSLPRLATQQRDPMEVFDHAVAKGMMTSQAAIGCMVAKRKQLEGLKSLDNLSTSRTASRVVQWLRSSGAEKDLRFLDSKNFVRALTPFLVAEGLEEVAWEWLTRAVNGPSVGRGIDSDKQLRRASLLLAELVHTKCQYGSLDSAISTMLQAQQMFRTSPILSELLVQSWRSVSWFSTVEAYTRTAPSEDLFEAHLATADRLPRPFAVQRAHLHLHHPTHPDAVPALRFFENKTLLRKIVNHYGASEIKQLANKRLSIIPWLSFLGHDTVSHLTQEGRAQEAQGVTEILQAEFGGLSFKIPEPVG